MPIWDIFRKEKLTPEERAIVAEIERKILFYIKELRHYETKYFIDWERQHKHMEEELKRMEKSAEPTTHLTIFEVQAYKRLLNDTKNLISRSLKLAKQGKLKEEIKTLEGFKKIKAEVQALRENELKLREEVHKAVLKEERFLKAVQRNIKNKELRKKHMFELELLTKEYSELRNDVNYIERSLILDKLEKLCDDIIVLIEKK